MIARYTRPIAFTTAVAESMAAAGMLREQAYQPVAEVRQAGPKGHPLPHRGPQVVEPLWWRRRFRLRSQRSATSATG